MTDLVTSFHACYNDLVRHLTRKVGCHATAEDLVQDLYLRIADTNLLFNGAFPRGFIFTAATNLARDLWRRERRAPRAEDVELLAANITSEAPSVERVVAAKQQLRKVALALAELSPKCRDAFVQSRIHGLTHAEIAVKMGLSERMVAKYIVKALDHCRRLMDED